MSPPDSPIVVVSGDEAVHLVTTEDPDGTVTVNDQADGLVTDSSPAGDP